MTLQGAPHSLIRDCVAEIGRRAHNPIVALQPEFSLAICTGTLPRNWLRGRKTFCEATIRNGAKSSEIQVDPNDAIVT